MLLLLSTYGSKIDQIENANNFPAHRNYLLNLATDIALKQNYVITDTNKQVETVFNTFIDSLCNSDKFTIEHKNKAITDFMDNLENYKTTQINQAKAKLDKITKDGHAALLNELAKTQQKKLDELVHNIDVWYKTLMATKKKISDNKKLLDRQYNITSELAGSLSSLKNIVKSKTNQLKRNDFDILESCFKDTRNWLNEDKINSDDPNLPIKNSNIQTNQIVLSLLGMITDHGTDKQFNQIFIRHIIKQSKQ